MKIYVTICFCVLGLWTLNPVKAQTKIPDSTQTKKLKEVKIQSRTNGNQMDALSPTRVEKLTQTELKKNACCNLAESFESSPSVEVSFSNALTGARQIQMLGLSGTYVQMLTDLLPSVRGLNYTYGFSNIPGTQVNSIYINKGPGSVTNGFESMTGLIDVELQKPEKSPKLFVNGYMNTFLRTELNANSAVKLNKKWSTMVMTHGSGMQRKMDQNKDGYLDAPLYTQLNGIHRWKYEGDKLESMFGVKGLYDSKTGGQTSYNQFLPKEEQSHFGFGMKTKRWELFNKTSYRFDDCGSKSLGLQYMYSDHIMNGFYGRNDYTGRQKTFYANLIYQTFIKEEAHEVRVGGSLLYDAVHEAFKQIHLDRKEPVSGVFAEYTYKGSEVWSLMLGARTDYNARLNKLFFIPRVNAKYSLSKKASLRGSIGSGFRTANILAENAQVLVSNREIKILDNLNPEYSWNYGLNFSYCYMQSGKEGRFSLDIFKTDFKNQVIADFDASPREVLFYNVKGKSYAWYIQAEWYYELIKNLDVRLAYKFNEVKVTQQAGLMEKVLNPRHRALLNLAYTTRNKKWKTDFTTQWVGKQRLADLRSNPEEFRLTEYSPSYYRMLGQITYTHQLFDIYIGSENINNFIQKQVIIDGNNPFGTYFDASNIWGPTMGRIGYLGFRYTIQ